MGATSQDQSSASLSSDGEALPFPTQVFGPHLSGVPAEYATAAGVPVDFAAIPMLIVASGAIGRTHVLDTEYFSPMAGTLWCAVVAPPGSGKDSTWERVAQPLTDRERDWRGDYAQEQHAYIEDLARYKLALKTWEKDHGAGPMPVKPEEPRLREVLTTDFTVEAIGRLLEANPRGVVARQEELAGFISGMNQYKGGHGSDRDKWLEMWGQRAAKKHRASADTVFIAQPYVPLFGGIQPVRLPRLRDEHDAEDGFIHRFLFSYPKTPAMRLGRRPSKEAVHAWEHAVDRMLELQFREDDKPYVVKLSPRAKAEFKRFFDTLAADVNARDETDSMRGPLVKLSVYWTRLALVLHFLRWAGSPERTEEKLTVDETVAYATTELITEYFWPHMNRVYAQLSSSEAKIELRIVTQLDKLREGHWMQRRELQRALGNVKVDVLAPALDKLTADRVVQRREGDADDGIAMPEYRLKAAN